MYQKLNNYIAYIPMLIVWEYLLLFIIRYSNWYAINAKLIDDIDNWIVLFTIVHFLIFIDIYSKLQIIYLFCMFLIIQLQLAYYFIPENIYYLLYLLLITYPIIRTFF